MADGPEAITEDFILGRRVLLRQPRHGYRAAIDPVLLAAAVPAEAGSLVLDVGVGVGAAALCLLARVPNCRVVGLELQPCLAALARDNACANGRGDRLSIVEGNVADAPSVGAPFDIVMTNPPFLAADKARLSENPVKRLANAEGDVRLEDWIRFCAANLRAGGVLVIIHRADRLDDLLGALRAEGCGSIRVVPLWPGAGKPAARVIVMSEKEGRRPTMLLPGLLLHGPGGEYSEAAERILRHAEALRCGAP
jgi:tRNA1(Val) A37 N6-methylase TrmN6